MEDECGPRGWSGRARRSSSLSEEHVLEQTAVTSGIPEGVRRFLLQCIDSVEQLEVLLHLYRTPEQTWSSESIARLLYSNPASIAHRLARLHANGLLAETSGSVYRYQPKTAELDATVSQLAETYRQRRVAVITVIASKPMENVRAFSEAFRLRKKDKE
jgi:hypothetical protein